MLSRLKRKDEDSARLDNEVSSLAISRKSLACACSPVESEMDTTEETKAHLIFFMPEVCTMAGFTQYEIAEILTLSKFMTAQHTGWDCHAAFASVEKPNNRFSADCDEVLAVVSSLHSASQRLVTAFIRPCSFTSLPPFSFSWPSG